MASVEASMNKMLRPQGRINDSRHG